MLVGYLTDASCYSIPDEVLAFISELDEVRLKADGIEASVKTPTLHKLQSHKKLHPYIDTTIFLSSTD